MPDANDQREPVRTSRQRTHKAQQRPDFECIALLLQGGGALGAYQAGVYEALSEAHLHPDWIAGISIGAINAALIAGNPPQVRVEKLRKFWDLVTTPPIPLWAGAGPWAPTAAAEAVRNLMAQRAAVASTDTASPALVPGKPETARADHRRGIWENIVTGACSAWLADPWFFVPRGDAARSLANQLSAGLALVGGAPGFFAPRVPVPWLQPAGAVEATSYYDNAPLRATLERLVDFDRINAGEMRFSVGAVNVATGNFVYFDSSTQTIGPEHIMASGALPPSLPAIEIEGEHYWDGGLVSNTPLQWVLESASPLDTLAFQVDLWSARGAFPASMAEVMTRQKEIQYSSRTRANSDRFKYAQKIRGALAGLLEKLPEELKNSPEVSILGPVANRKVYNLVQLVYRSKHYEGDSKDFEFSRPSMEEHWRAGYHDTIRTLRHPEVLERPTSIEGVFSFDLAYDGRE